VNFDPYGLVLESYDLLGRYRTEDLAGRAIDPNVTLPDAVGGTTVTGANEMGVAIVESGAFTACMVGNLLEEAIGEGALFADSCAVQDASLRIDNSEGTFSDLVREVVGSRALLTRRGAP
jgi:hypothetical protein